MKSKHKVQHEHQDLRDRKWTEINTKEDSA